MQVGTSGNMDFTLSQTSTGGNPIDVDFILWGPFNSTSGICNNLALYSPGYTGANNVVDCSYLNNATEQVNITGAVAGQFYMLLVTNFSGSTGTYTLNQNGGSGGLSCEIVCGVNLGPDQLFCSSTISNYTITATFNETPSTAGSPVYSWYLGGVLQTTTTTNTLMVNQSGTWSVSVVRPGCSDIATDDIEIRFDSPPNPISPNDITAPVGLCTYDFDLTSVESAMLSPALPSNYIIKYYLDENDCFTGNANFITTPTAFTASTTTTIYVRIENIGNPICSDSNQSFDVIINCIPSSCSLVLSSPVGTDTQTVCQNSAITNIVYTAGGDATNVTVSGLPTGLSGAYASGVFTISGSPTQSGSFTYTVTTVGCTPNLSEQGTIVVNPTVVPVTGFSYTTPICSNDANITPTTVAGFTTGGIFSSTTGLTIDAASGEINVGTSTPGSYTVTYTFAATTCGPLGTSTFDIVITAAPVATISYAGSPYCATGLASVTQTGNTGGVYSSTTGLVIDSSTGEINLATSTTGTYTVTYTIAAAGGCSLVAATTSITINPTVVPVTGFSYTTPVCNNVANITPTTVAGFTTGGIFSSTTGLTIDAASGEINVGTSTPGSYTVTYTFAATTCGPLGTSTFDIVITAAPVATISYAGSPYCATGLASVTQTGNTGGVYSSTTGLVIDSSTGEINLATSTSGTYTVTYTIAAAGGCSLVAATTTITINPTVVPVTGFSYTTPVCSNDANITPTTVAGFTTGGIYSSTTGLTIDAASGEINVAASTPGNYTVTYTFAATTCGPLGTSTFDTVITAAPVATISYAGSPYCATGLASVTQTGNTGGVYSSTTGLVIDSSTGEINLATSTTGTYTVTYTIAAAGGCSLVAATTTITINPTVVPVTGFSYTTPVCSNDANITPTTVAGFTTGGIYSSTTGLTIDAASGEINVAASTPGNYTVTYTFAATTCGPLGSSTFDIVITAAPVATISYAGSPYCATGLASVTQTGNTGGVYSSTTGLVIDSSTGEINLATSTTGTYTVTYTIAAAGGCSLVAATTSITINPIIVPVTGFSYTTPVCNNVANITPTTVSGFTTGGIYSSTTGLTIDASSGEINVGTSTPGNYTVTYTFAATTCGPLGTSTFDIVITAAPVATISYAGSPYCATGLASVTQTGNTGGVYSSTTGLVIDSSTGEINLAISTTGTYTVTYTIAAAGGCSLVAATTSITINPIIVPVTGFSYTTPVCNNVANITPTTVAGFTTGGIFSSTTGLTIDAASGEINVVTSTPGSYTVNYAFAATTCGPLRSSTFNVLISPLPVVNSVTSNPICVNTSGIVTFNATPNSTITYTINGGSNQTINIGNTGIATVNTSVLTTNATYTLVSIVSNLAPFCTQNQTGGTTVVVNPIPDVIITPAQTIICSGTSTSINLSSSVSGATFSWVIAGQSNVSGAFASNGNIISQILTNTSGGSGYVDYLVTPSANSCTGPSQTIRINVTPRPIVVAVNNNPSFCSGGTTDIQLTSNVAGATFSWTASSTTVTGQIGSISGSGATSINQILTLNAGAAAAGQVVYAITAELGGCSGDTVFITINVNPIPDVNIASDPSPICSGSSTNISFTGTVPGTIFTWVVTNSTGVTGASNNSGSSLQQVLTSTSLLQGSVTYEVTPSLNGCIGVAQSITVLVNPTPELFGSPIHPEICSGNSTLISVSTFNPNTIIDWTFNAVGVSGASVGSSTGLNALIINELFTTENVQGYVDYIITPRLDSCTGNQFIVRVYVNPLPLPLLTVGNICIDDLGNTFQTYLLNSELDNINYDFVWYLNGVAIPNSNNATYAADLAGVYGVIATNSITGCPSSTIAEMVTVNVGATTPATSVNVLQSNYFSGNATLTVNAVGGNGTLLYSLDDGTLQSSNVFTNVSAGNHTVVVLDTNGCTYLTYNVFVIEYPQYFTPNGDGYNDGWFIAGLQDTDVIYIFDRYGKLIKQLMGEEKWDGTYNQAQLPSTDYWFTVDYVENTAKKQFKAHFSLKR